MQLKGAAVLYLSEMTQSLEKLIILTPSLTYGRVIKVFLKLLYTLSNCGLPSQLKGILTTRSYLAVINFIK
jgi:hypothetical protein